MINRDFFWQPGFEIAMRWQPGWVIVAYDMFLSAAIQDAFMQVYGASNEWSVDNVFN